MPPCLKPPIDPDKDREIQAEVRIGRACDIEIQTIFTNWPILLGVSSEARASQTKFYSWVTVGPRGAKRLG